MNIRTLVIGVAFLALYAEFAHADDSVRPHPLPPELSNLAPTADAEYTSWCGKQREYISPDGSRVRIIFDTDGKLTIITIGSGQSFQAWLYFPGSTVQYMSGVDDEVLFEQSYSGCKPFEHVRKQA